ncbi:hypothetical protein BDP27DRAFT_1416540 [Rhodocollybia butyracea]|uniref:Bacteriophage T5 Orf172 DNA-binding domain-containing protein n=1 Tax=Rhodocollybia butyracea TaxID=206335 RepID=A0A9P5PXD6_9AGAR|nr:hypothetical protein BDP27DRAFT_1416540 [Rhodocollybia butyracea]
MVKRPTTFLDSLITQRHLRPESVADGPGEVYFLLEKVIAGNIIVAKLGMTTDFDRRFDEHERICPQTGRLDLWRKEVPYRRRTEALLHLYLEDICVDRPRVICSSCGRKHIELFKFHSNQLQSVLSFLDSLVPSLT